jgi:hypothetical protein
LAEVGLAAVRLSTVGLATVGLATAGLATTGLAIAGRATAESATAGLAAVGLAAVRVAAVRLATAGLATAVHHHQCMEMTLDCYNSVVTAGYQFSSFTVYRDVLLYVQYVHSDPLCSVTSRTGRPWRKDGVLPVAPRND